MFQYSRKVFLLIKTPYQLFPRMLNAYRGITFSPTHIYFSTSYEEREEYGEGDPNEQETDWKRKYNRGTPLTSQISNGEQGTFTSKFYSISTPEITQFLDEMELKWEERGDELVVRECPLCRKPHYNEKTNLYTLNIHKWKGCFFCFRCGAKGSWFDLRKSLSSIQVVDIGHMEGRSMDPLHNQMHRREENNIEADVGMHCNRHIAMQEGLFPDSMNYLEGREIRREVLNYYKVGVGLDKFRNDKDQYVDYESIFFPMYSPAGVSLKSLKSPKSPKSPMSEKERAEEVINSPGYRLSRCKIRAIYAENKHRQKLTPTGSKRQGLFGLNTVPESAESLVITEGEYDAMAVYQSTGFPTISLPNGANNLPLECLPWLEKYTRIYLWLDSDIVGRAAATKFAHKLGISRCFIVDTRRADPMGPKDANEALNKGRNLTKYLLDARPIIQENIICFGDLKDQVMSRLLQYELNVGMPCLSFPWYNKKLKGLRRGELTVLTGSTGSGKTTFLSQLSLDFLRQGLPTLWGSFEIKNEILASSMLLQYANKDLISAPELIPDYVAEFESLPLYFLKYYGATVITEVLSTLEYAIYAFDIGHIIIDNLQFLMGNQGKGIERFDIQDQLISKMRTLASERDVHITLVIHPKKVDEDHADLSVSSVFGSAKATQEADNLFILQNRHKYRHMDIRKNRFDGETGRVGLGFSKPTRRFFELKDTEIFDLNTTGKGIGEIIQGRLNIGEEVGGFGEGVGVGIAVGGPVLKCRVEREVESDILKYKAFGGDSPGSPDYRDSRDSRDSLEKEAAREQERINNIESKESDHREALKEISPRPLLEEEEVIEGQTGITIKDPPITHEELEKSSDLPTHNQPFREKVPQPIGYPDWANNPQPMTSFHTSDTKQRIKNITAVTDQRNIHNTHIQNGMTPLKPIKNIKFGEEEGLNNNISEVNNGNKFGDDALFGTNNKRERKKLLSILLDTGYIDAKKANKIKWNSSSTTES